MLKNQKPKLKMFIIIFINEHLGKNRNFYDYFISQL